MGTGFEQEETEVTETGRGVAFRNWSPKGRASPSRRAVGSENDRAATLPAEPSGPEMVGRVTPCAPVGSENGRGREAPAEPPQKQF